MLYDLLSVFVEEQSFLLCPIQEGKWSQSVSEPFKVDSALQLIR